MAATKAPPAHTLTEPRLDRFYNLKRAAEWFDLNDPDDPEDEAGIRWLRDGFNRPLDGSKGRPFPGQYMSGRLVFSASDLAEIHQISREETDVKRRAKDTPAPSTGRPRRRKALALATP